MRWFLCADYRSLRDGFVVAYVYAGYTVGMRRIFVAWSPVVAWMVVIFVFSQHSSVRVSETYFWNFVFFKFLHLVEYFILYLASLRATAISGIRQPYAVSLFITALYAVSDEIHQSFVPSREPHIRDVIIDISGGILAWKTVSALLPVLPRKVWQWAGISRLSSARGSTKRVPVDRRVER